MRNWLEVPCRAHDERCPLGATLRSVLFNSFIGGGTVGLIAPSSSLQVASDDPSHCIGQWTTTFSPPPQTHSKAQPSPDAEKLHCRNCLWWTQTKKDSVIQKISIYSVDSCSHKWTVLSFFFFSFFPLFLFANTSFLFLILFHLPKKLRNLIFTF